MRTSIYAAALILAGSVFIGCDDKKDTTTVTTPDGKTATITTPAAPTMDDTKKTTDKMGDAIKNGTQKVEDATKSGLDKLGAEAQKLKPSSTQPTMPDVNMPK